ncbi:TonB-dependent receptor plug domain-containing protein [Ketobacter sp.]|uniref:TonB-dependent receptor plug domain-containing protein n=1 Tax=Ketobacter sp. TaxID=2083498 RepID=UPI0025C07068|nr:TonB-dependent receptor [Ketobacter sp.]
MGSVKGKTVGWLALGCGLGLPMVVQADGLPQLKEEIRWLQEERYVTTATKTRESVRKSGATVTVITAADVQQMGARDLMDVLKRVPGFGINRFNMGTSSVEVRGVKTDFSEKVLFLINGHPVNNNLVNGGALSSYNRFPVKDIKVVEIVRGPGSALYGANAFVAVVNIITKQAEDVNGVVATAAAGSDETNRLDLQYGGTLGAVDVAVDANLYHSDGWKGEVASDAIGQSGDTDYWQKRYDLGFNAGYGEFSLQGRFVQREAGGYLGANNVLNDGSEQEYREYFLEGAHHYDINPKAFLTTKLYFDHFEFDNLWDVFPPGFDDGSTTYPEGLFLRSPIQHDKTGIELQLTWNWLNGHKLVSGVMFEHQAQYGVELWTNNGQGPMVDISDVANWNDSHNRNVRALYVQDIWDPSEQVRLIVGGRYDDYSDFGNTFNPRASVSWDFSERFQGIATYGSAFRAPTFGELYNINNPAIVGNPLVEPEEIETVELGLNAWLSKRSTARATLFRNNIENIIGARPQPPAVAYYDNIGELTVQGIELEYAHRLQDGSSINLNYTYQDPINDLTDRRAADVPLHRANMQFNYRYSRHISAYLGVLYESSLSREALDTRADVSDQTEVDVSITWRSRAENLVLTASLYNLLDKDLVDPAPGVMLSDYPNPGRNFMLELQFKL